LKDICIEKLAKTASNLFNFFSILFIYFNFESN